MADPKLVQHRAIRKSLSALERTPLHPQWFALRGQAERLRAVCRTASGRVLDIGCADQRARSYLPPGSQYIGLDYYATAIRWYETRPQVYGDAAALPFRSAEIDWVLLLDVLEHLPTPDSCLSEIARVLKPGGKLVLQVPFLYPLHDAPLDFHRWTLHGLRLLAERFGFAVLDETPLGNTLESTVLIANIALSRLVLEWVSRKNPLAILAFALPLFVVCANLLAWAGSFFVARDDFMPFGYTLLLARK
jgi:SAM-dependent methyltransferase